MAVTVHILSGEPALSLNVDAPRIVIGRSKGCEVQLPDPSVSARHASLRLDQGKPVIVDEGSTNGVVIDGTRIPPRTPWPLRDGELVRVGRLWLRLELGASAGAGDVPPARRARAVALKLLARQRAAAGEPAAAWIEVVDGPDAGARLELDADREHVIGRAREADLLLGDPIVSRQHLLVRREGADWEVRDGGSKRGSSLDGAPLDARGRSWRDGAIVCLGDTVLRMCAPLDEALAEAFAESDVRMRPEELALAPPGGWLPRVLAGSRRDEAPPDDEPLEEPELALPAVVEEVLAEPPSGRALGAVDALVALLAVGLLGVSAAGIYWVLY